MKPETKDLVEKLLSEKGLPSAPDAAPPVEIASDSYPEGGDASYDEEGQTIANERGTITFTPSECEDCDVAFEVISFLKAVKDACPEDFAVIQDAVAAGLEDEGEGAEGDGDAFDMVGALGGAEPEGKAE